MPDHASLTSDRTSVPVSKSASTYINVDFRRAIVPNRVLIVTWRILIIVAALTGIILNSKNLNDFVAKLLYFTIQSNLILTLFIAYAAWTIWSNRTGPAPFLKGAVTVYITITCLVYNLILAKAAASSPPPPGTIMDPLLGGTLSNDLLHMIAPIMAILDWVLFDAHGNLSWRYPLQWLVYPLAYLAFVLIRGVLVTGPFLYPNLHYPYPFLNVDKIGYGGVALNTLIYGIAFWLIGIAFVILDRTLTRFNRQAGQ
jgi:hypothetical protein